MTKPIISFRVPDSTDLDEWLADRASRMANANGINSQARTELMLWRSALRVELGMVRFTLGEISCIADVLKSTMLDATIGVGGPGITHSLLYGEISYEFAHATGISSYGRKWGIDEKALLGKMAGIGPVADHALRDAIASWWADRAPDDVDGFRLYGINVVPDPTPGQEA